MGGDIAIWCVKQGLKVTLQDISNSQIAKVINKASIDLKRNNSSIYEQYKFKDKLIPDSNGEGIKKADVIIEAASENLEAKKNIFKNLEANAKENALLCSNTSSIKIENIASGLKDPSRVIGVHFFNPVSKMPLVEIIKTNNCDLNFLNLAFIFTHRIKKLPLPVKSSPGFLVNAVLVPYLVSAMRSIDSGINPEEIDSAMKSWGMPMGPIELIDVVGLDIILAVGTTMSKNESLPTCLIQLTNKKNYGKKSGEGFYKWKNGKKILRNKISLSKEESKSLAENLIHPLIVKTKSLVDEGIVENMDLADAGVIFGTGFAPFRGGPLHFSKGLTSK
jgi:3-hydroxyacyl-CoA dehydrogenase/enoyl-CoA hydratase/3-hydroxybutyryl-CoA epimerase